MSGMQQKRLARVTTPLVITVVIVALLLLADGIVAVRLVSSHPTALGPQATQNKPGASTHPCNHGFYVSQAAHAKKGGGHVSGIAKSKLGKDGNCTAPLPAQAPHASGED